ncbi:rod shape-determining protein RodA [Aneurinibacillus terranovensis]|uniref:rod shape-determining protein RodA n=1 Tax=Aneurinibacillus terranovensis TaxID=278991 RepID=UPI0004083587|nr:rod shape-determining protein RodA [Aneurinibacillus terranovensis]
MDLDKRYLRNLDWLLIIVLIMLGIFSFIGISGAKPDANYHWKQIIWYGVGFAFLTIVLLFDYHSIGNLSYGLYAFGMLLIIGVLFMPAKNNAHSWYQLGFMDFQPSELMKIFVIVTVARFLSKKDEKEDEALGLREIVPAVLLIGVPLLLILIQPDLGTALVFTGILFSMLTVARTPIKYFVILGFCISLVFVGLAYLYNFNKDAFFKIMKPYQWMRIESWFNPDAYPKEGYQLRQSLTAIGSGQLLGKGIDGGTQARNGWVPVGESDFVFTVIGEELGFVGSSILVFLFFFMVYRMVRIAMDSKDTFGSYIAAGVIGMIVFQTFENIGMTIQLMPITGIPLPFISYGGSSLISNFLVMGMVMNVGMRRKKLMFE